MYSKSTSALLLCKTWVSNAKTLITCNVLENTYLHHQHQRHWFCSLAQAGANTFQKMSDNRCSHVTRVLFCGPHFPDSHNYTREYLQGYPFVQVDDVPLESVPAVIGDYEISVVKSFRMNSDVLSRAKRMKLIMQFGVGLEGVDINAATKHGIKVAKIPGGATGNAASCAEMAIYLILGLLRKQNQMKISVEQKKLGEPTGDSLQGKTVFILGFGNIGIHLAKRLRPFDVKILATKRSWGRLAQDSSKSEGKKTL
ncbi:hypothetical protein H5410_055857 [Solanum commersonii]|uniref:Uncharacterized protein n=1 Tax=Solanum commersonii TaxID=4109 RepID=A0A9J5WIP6_SOLCO|nr:hypothetical protein H5410_055857 [Solanum commersonii]